MTAEVASDGAPDAEHELPELLLLINLDGREDHSSLQNCYRLTGQVDFGSVGRINEVHHLLVAIDPVESEG
ncbi:hypothetical protein ACFV83_04390 [Streptomyces pharetrae]